MAFGFRRQPLKTIYLVYSVVTILFVRLPLWLITFAAPSWRPRPSWSMTRSLIVQAMSAAINIMYQTSLPSVDTAEDEDSESADRLGLVWIDGVPEGFVLGDICAAAKTNRISPVKVPGYWYGRRADDGKYGHRAGSDERVLYILHGGGYVMSTGSPKGSCFPITTGLLEYNSVVFTRAFAVEYRLASAAPFKLANPFPAALIDALSGYRYLIEHLGFAPQNIIIEGDSAGGHLALVLTRYLLTVQLPSLPPPGALLLLSPTVDWGCTHIGPNSSMEKNRQSDVVYAVFDSGYSARALLGSLPPSEISTNAWLSPASLDIPSPGGIFKFFPCTFILSGGAELTVDPMRTLRDRMISDNGPDKVLYMEYEDATHDFLALTWHEPERSQAFQAIKEWLDKL